MARTARTPQRSAGPAGAPPRGKGTVFVLDDDADVGATIVRLVDDVGLPARAFTDPDALMDEIDPETAGCLVLDVRMPGKSGIQIQRDLTSAGCELPVIIVTAHGNVSMAVDAMRRGALDFLEKPFRAQELLDRIQYALELDARRRRDRAERRTAAAKMAQLTPRERQVVEMAVRGRNNREIARQLGVTSQAIDARRARAMEKLGVGNIAELVRLTERCRPAPPPPPG